MRELNKYTLEGSSLAPRKKEWIASAIGAGLGLATSLFGGISASKAAKEAERRQRQQEAKENAWYQRRYNQDYADTAAGQNLLRKAREAGQNYVRRAEGAAKVAGSTDAATAQAKEAALRMQGDTIAEIAEQDTARKDRVDDMHRQAEDKFAQMDMNREMQRAQDITQAAQGASNAIMSVAGALDSTTSSLKGSNNKGTPVIHTGGQVPSEATIDGTPDPITPEQAAAQGVDADLVNKIRRVNG